jgi:hypothetical protein
MKNKENTKKSDKEKLKALTKLLSPRKRNYDNNGEESSQEVIFKVRDNCELRYIISCLLRVSISALETEGTSPSPRIPYFSNELAVVTILELIDNMLPDDQLESYDNIEKLLLSDKENSF